MPVQALYPYNRYGGIWSLAAQAQNKGLNKWPIPPILGLWEWGTNNYGQLGLNNITYYSSPKQVTSNITWTSISLKINSFNGVQSNGTLWSWGYNGNGELGLNNLTNYSSPKQVGALTNWSKVSTFNAGGSLAIKTNGTLWAWGTNNYGQLGNNNNTNYSSPIQVGALTNWASIDISYITGAGIKTDGTLWMWGYNGYGNMGLGNRTWYSSPKQVGALTNWSKISVAFNHYTVASRTDGTLWVWGNAQNGNLGLGSSTTQYSSPMQVGALTNWSQPSTGYFSTYVTKTDGTLWSWGYNANGDLGLNNRTYYSSPKQVGALTTWAKVFASTSSNAAAVKTDATLWVWGNGANGALGLGNTTRYSSPKQVGSLSGWGNVAVGSFTTVATGYWDISPP